ncbi:MAG: ATP-binding cassette domain-containing protein [Deltaproteobacteria bacterium]|nr:ATP-binding cassette domain-containing protein [Deltaproteobacteria bacterium]
MRLRGITKAFVRNTPVLHGVDFEVAAGEIHSLLGENGAGKSTLMNVLVGLVRPDAGTLAVAGEPVEFTAFGPAQAARCGIGMLHQHSALVPAMTVVENFAFGDPDGSLLFRPARSRSAVQALAERFDFEVPLDRRVEDLSVGERQRAEILRVLGRGARVLILDEPTSVLTPGETRRLFTSLRRLREAGCSVVFISHKLGEVEEIADRVTVLRRGRVAGVLDIAEGGSCSGAISHRSSGPGGRRSRSRVGHRCCSCVASPRRARPRRAACVASISWFARARSSGSRGSTATVSVSSRRCSRVCARPRPGNCGSAARRSHRAHARCEPPASRTFRVIARPRV